MKFKCPKCNKIVFRDMRDGHNKKRMTKRGFKSACDYYGGNVFLKPVKTNQPKETPNRKESK